ncbi:24189_t:CDS:2, partial [Entrophospora sp. SA101]
ENTVINESISERRIETMNYVAEDIVEEFLVRPFDFDNLIFFE